MQFIISSSSSHMEIDAVVGNLLLNSKYIVALVGAGISRSCGIPDFRSKDGIYSIVGDMDLGLPQPECLFELAYFEDDPIPFYKFAHKLYQYRNVTPSKTHKFLKYLEQEKRLLRVYTQNIDELEKTAGITRVIQCHGTLSSVKCMRCKKKASVEEISKDIDQHRVAHCQKLDRRGKLCEGLIKPMITFFGEAINNQFEKCIERDIEKADLVLVIGTSLQVAPISQFPSKFPENVPRILINQQSLTKVGFNHEMLGDCDTICTRLQEHMDSQPRPCKRRRK